MAFNRSSERISQNVTEKGHEDGDVKTGQNTDATSNNVQQNRVANGGGKRSGVLLGSKAFCLFIWFNKIRFFMFPIVSTK